MVDLSREISGRLPQLARASAAVSTGARRPLGLRLLVLLIVCSPAAQTLARDVVREQSAVEYAREEYERADAEHKADLAQAERTRKALESLKKQFAQEQNKARLSAKTKQQAKARLDEARGALDRAWKE